MAPVPATITTGLLLTLLSLAVGHPAQEESPEEQLSRLLGPVVESALTRVLSGWQPPALSNLTRLQARLEVLERHLAEPRLTSQVSSRCLPEPTCHSNPTPLAAGSAPHQKPALLACARSCLQLRDQGVTQDGVYWFTGMPVPVLCDFSHDGGGWTLLLTAATGDGWDALSVLGRSQNTPSLTDNYSILRHGDAIRDLGSGGQFAYRIEAQAETGRRHWGGVWLAPRGYSFVHQSKSQTNVQVIRKFNSWSYSNDGIEQRMPWLNRGSGDAVLTTSASPSHWWWGTLVTVHTQKSYKHSPWISDTAAKNSGVILYWTREQIS